MAEKTIQELNRDNQKENKDSFGKPWSTDVYCNEEEKPFILYVPFGQTYEEYYNEKHKPVCPRCGNNDIVRIIINKIDYLKREPVSTDDSKD